MDETTGGGEAADATDTEPTKPFLRVVRGDATPEEVAALVAVLGSLGAPAPAKRKRPPEWSAPHRLVRRTPPHGPGGWRSSGLPG